MKKKTTKIKLECMECGKKFKRSGTKLEYQCPKCHGYDIDLDYSQEEITCITLKQD